MSKYTHIFEEFSEEREENKKVFSKDKKNKTPFLDNFGRDITKLAKENKVGEVIGRTKEIDQIMWILSRKEKNNPIIIGEPGVGKTAIVEGIAKMIVSPECPDTLCNKRIIYIDMGTIMAGTSKQGDLEQKINALLKELEENRDVILFIDEIHMIVNPNLSIDFGNMIKPALARGEMRLIGATTLNEYRNSIEKDGALERRFQKVIVEQTSVEDTINILRKINKKYGDFHNVEYSDESLIACVKLANKYITDRFFPDKAIDLLDEVGARVRLSKKKDTPPEIKKLEIELHKAREEKTRFLQLEDFENLATARTKEKEIQDKLENANKKYKETSKIPVTKENVEKVIQLKTGIPINKLGENDSKRLINLEKDLKIDVIGQDEAVTKVSKAIRRSRAGLKDPNRPMGVFMFLGTTGTGKTHLVKTLAKHIFTSQNDMIRVDMSEYSEKHNVSRLIGSPPGYVGYGEGGQLTEKVRRKPYSIVLFDELEKAHPSVLNIMLQIFDDGHLTDGEGRKVDFRNTIIVMTSNIGATLIKNKINHVGFGTSSQQEQKEDNAKQNILNELKNRLSPEFLNRIDDIIVFNKLSKDSIYRIIDNEINKLRKKVEDRGFTINITDNVKDLLIEKGYDENMGARPLKRAIQNYLENPISDQIIMGKIESEINVDYDPKIKKISINGEMVNESKKRIITKFSIFS